MKKNQLKIIFTLNPNEDFEILQTEEIKISANLQSSINEIPFVIVEIRAKHDKIMKLNALEKKQKIKIFSNQNLEFQIFFEGLIHKFTMEIIDDEILYKINCASEFLKFTSYIPPNLDNKNEGKNFEQVVKGFMIDNNMNGIINTDDNVEATWKILYCQNMPAMAIIKNYLRVNKLLALFKPEGNIQIIKRHSVEDFLNAPVVHQITEKDIKRFKIIVE